MASAVNNLRINNKEVRKIYFNDKILKEFYYNETRVWKIASPFEFAATEKDYEISKLSSDTIIFVGFSKKNFNGSYTNVENAEAEKGN